MELLCSGREALAVYTESKKVLDQQLPVSSLESALKSSEVDEEYDLLNSLNCHRCNGLIMDPVCLPCGHCLCKTCVEKAAVAVGVMRKRQVECPSCKQRWACQSGQGNSNRNSNVLLSKIWNESFPKRRKAYEYKEDGNKFATEKDFPLAIDSYTLALREDPLEHRVLSNRSRAYLVLESRQEALKDAQDCCVLKPLWNKGHFRRGAALEALGRSTEAVSAYLLCLHLGGSDCSVHKKLCHLLKSILEGMTGSKEERRSSIVNEIVCMCQQSMETLIQAYHTYKPQLKQVLEQFRVEEGDLDCVLCAGILLDPITTFCGHTFCRSCLCRSFDHTPLCPVCRSALSEVSGRVHPADFPNQHAMCVMSPPSLLLL
jgi:hypothetical protein